MGRALTQALPGIAGRTRASEEDFLVEEVLSYEPCGSGTHLYFEIEKRGLSSMEAIRRIARGLGRKESDIGCAGHKDKRAVTRQTLSLEFANEDELRALQIPGIEVRKVTKHKNKLKLGHLRGNRFVIRIRESKEGDLDRAEAKLAVLRSRGLPNAFGAQRFGRDRSTPALGRALLDDEPERFLRIFAGADADATAEEIQASHTNRDPLLKRALDAWVQRGRADQGMRALPRRFLSLCVSALQSEAFNEVLARRLDAIDTIEDGDVAFLHRNGACFAVDGRDAVDEALPRVDAFEISPSGPLPGPSCLRPGAAVAALEDAVLEQVGVTHEIFACKKPWAQKGGRRALRVPLEDASVRACGDNDLELRFALPKGSFATAVLDELFAG